MKIRMDNFDIEFSSVVEGTIFKYGKGAEANCYLRIMYFKDEEGEEKNAVRLTDNVCVFFNYYERVIPLKKFAILFNDEEF